MCMSRTSLITAAIVVAFCSAAHAEAPCLEGRAPQGGCLNPMLASVVRQGTIIASQPKISYTAPLNLPSQDGFFPQSRQRYEYLNLFASRAPRPGDTPPNPATMP